MDPKKTEELLDTAIEPTPAQDEPKDDDQLSLFDVSEDGTTFVAHDGQTL